MMRNRTALEVLVLWATGMRPVDVAQRLGHQAWLWGKRIHLWIKLWIIQHMRSHPTTKAGSEEVTLWG